MLKKISNRLRMNNLVIGLWTASPCFVIILCLLGVELSFSFSKSNSLKPMTFKTTTGFVNPYTATVQCLKLALTFKFYYN